MRLLQYLLAKDEIKFVQELAAMLCKYKVFAFLKGEKGDPGPAGADGADGATGPQGLQGIPGVNGTSFNGEIDVTSDVLAVLNDHLKFIMLNSSGPSVTYSINPSQHTGKLFFIHAKSIPGGGNVAVTSGTIWLNTQISVTTLGLQPRETVRLYCDGTDLIQV